MNDQKECNELREANLRLQLELKEMRGRKDDAYFERNQVVAALAKCFPSGIAKTAIEGWSEDWHGCVYIDLPTGQASWHYHDSQAHLFAGLPPYTGHWDGHDTPEKYQRLAALPNGVSAVVAEDSPWLETHRQLIATTPPKPCRNYLQCSHPSKCSTTGKCEKQTSQNP